MNISDFKKGDVVRYIGCRADIVGKRARVVRQVKSRGVVTIDWLDQMPGTLSRGYFDAMPGNLEHVKEGAGPGSTHETCQTCQGNGEIVTDWERYLHSHDGDIGDEAVAECPDCDGAGYR